MKKIYLWVILFLIICFIVSSDVSANFKIIINFDDGYSGVYDNAFPIMEEYNVPGVVFVITNELNQAKHLTVGQLRQLKSSGWEIGSHTICHYDLTKIIPSVREHEIKGSRDQLLDLGLLDDSYASFASPNGKWNNEINKLVSKTYQLARSDSLYIIKNNISYKADTKQRVVLKNTDLKQIKYWIKDAKTHDASLILIFHEIASGGNEFFYPADKFRDLIKFISKYETTTFHDYLNIL